nr:methionine ABC transporter permease [uncultured Roseococcus sp.]
MSPLLIERCLRALGDTLTMVGVSCLIVFAAGLVLGVTLVTTERGGLFPLPAFNRLLGLVINGFRAVPFIILLVVLLPFTRFVVGTTIGVWGAVVPLSISLIPFFARITEVSLREVDHGLVEAAQAMGCRRRHLIWHVLLPEALPGLIGGATIATVALIGASAMAGAVGAGGLGDLAIRYGYERYETTVMAYVIVILILLVSAVQLAGDHLARVFNRRR